VQKIHVVLDKALTQAVRWSLIPRNVTEAVKAPRPTPDEMRPLSREETAGCSKQHERTAWRRCTFSLCTPG
jgi:hypothetical protein